MNDLVRRYEVFAGSIAKIFRSIQKIENEEMKKYHLKGAFAQYLVVMNRYPEGITPTQLFNVCNKDKAIVSRAVSEMIEKGLITKPDVPGYRVPLFLTEKGKEAAQYAGKLGIPYVMLIGEEEAANGQVTLKDMNQGQQATMALEEAIAQIH